MKTVSSNMLGNKVLGNWGTAGFTYGSVNEILPEYNEVLVKWETNEDNLTKSYYELKDIKVVDEFTDIHQPGVYLDVAGQYITN
jgi:hypothetical protein